MPVKTHFLSRLNGRVSAQRRNAGQGRIIEMTQNEFILPREYLRNPEAFEVIQISGPRLGKSGFGKLLVRRKGGSMVFHSTPPNMTENESAATAEVEHA